MSATVLAWARRELRTGLKGFGIFLACLVIGVGAIATVTSLKSGIDASLRDDGRAILGGDLEARLALRPASEAEIASMARLGTVSAIARARGMVEAANDRIGRVEVQAVDDTYPLYGELRLETGLALDDAIAEVDGRHGAVVAPSLLDQLDIAIGDTIALGEETLQVRDVIAFEPDAASQGLLAGARVIVSHAAFEETGLIQPGSLIYWHYRLRLSDGDASAAMTALNQANPEAGWRLRDYTEAAPQVQRVIDRLGVFMVLVGLTALLVGGLGVGNAVRAFIEGRLATIATLKCLGATGATIFALYLVQIGVLALLGVVAGLALGAILMIAGSGLLSGVLPLEISVGIYPGALTLAAVFGALTALAFSLWPLSLARQLKASTLFRAAVMPPGGRPRAADLVAIGAIAALLAGLAIATADRPDFAAWFVAGAIGAFVVFRLIAEGLIRLIKRLPRPRRPDLRLALSSLSRPGTPTPMILLSLGIGLTVLVAIALIEGNMSRQVDQVRPADAPDVFLIDIQRDQEQRLREIVAETPGVEDLVMVPSLRGQITAFNGIPARQAIVAPEEDWVISGDRGVTYEAQPALDRYTIIAGEWWPADYDGPPLISIYEDIARAFGAEIGDRLTVNILGRDIEAEIASIRDIEWQNGTVNFTMVFSPNPLAAAPHTSMATVRTTTQGDALFERAIYDAFPNVTTIRVRDILASVEELLGQLSAAIRVVAAVTLVAGTLVLGGAMAAGHKRRTYDAVIFKVLGAARWDVVRAFLVEYGLLGLLAAAIAAVIGTAAAWGVITFVMEADWYWLAWPIASTLAIALLITLTLGMVGTWRALGTKAAPLLRNE
ncbi:MAG: FtsX-like permease family protein [Azospirillaceae bacterium]